MPGRGGVCWFTQKKDRTGQEVYMKKEGLFGVALCLCITLMAGCGKPRESDAAAALVNAINEDCKMISLVSDYGFVTKEIVSRDGQVHALYESMGITLAEAINDEEKKEGYLRTGLEIISKDENTVSIILTEEKDKENSFVFSTASVKIKELYPTFDFKEEDDNSNLVRVYSLRM